MLHHAQSEENFLKESQDSSVLGETPSNTLSEMSSTDSSSSVKKSLKPKKPLRKLETKVTIQCEWDLCTFAIGKMENYLAHVAGHVAFIPDSPTNDGFLCLWRSCGFATHCKDELQRHIYFHAFHSKIKAFGEIIMKELGYQCTIDDNSRNLIPEIPDPFECMWNACKFNFVSAQDFYWHVQSHVNPMERKKELPFLCSWEDCKYKGNTKANLLEHSRSHTQEKIVACPNCGSIFAGKNKFQDHCHRHLAQEFLHFECSHCKCKFATERLLKEHVRRHINHFKCPHCEMTCATKATMEIHIKYKHTNNKPFQCPECNKRFKLQYDVVKHLTTHSVEPNFVCIYPDCKYACRSYSSYRIHLRKIHEGNHQNPYACHMCDQSFLNGFSLTKHLKNIHDYHWPAGHSRFRYSKDENGFYRLQTTRFESLELAQEWLTESGEDADDPLMDSHPETKRPDDSPASNPPQEDSATESPTENNANSRLDEDSNSPSPETGSVNEEFTSIEKIIVYDEENCKPAKRPRLNEN